MPVGRRKEDRLQRLGQVLRPFRGLVLGLLMHVFAAPACAQSGGSGSASGISPFLGSADGSGETTTASGSGDLGV